MKRTLGFLLFLLALSASTIVNNDGVWLKEGMPVMYIIYGVLTIGICVIHWMEKSDRLLPVTAATYQYMLYMFALFVYFQKMIGGSKTIRRGDKYFLVNMGETEHMNIIASTILLAAILCVGAFVLLKVLDNRLYHLLGLACAVAIPMLLLSVHFFPSTNNAHIKMFGVLVAGPIMAMAPFATAYFLDLKALNDLHRLKQRRGPLALFIWLAICAMLAVWNNDLGIILLMGGAVGLVILSEIKGRHIKYGLVLGAMIAVVLVCVLKPSIRTRFEQAFTPYHIAYETVTPEEWDKLHNDSESLTEGERARLIAAENAEKQLFRNKGFFNNGWYGGGYGTITLRQNPERNNDYIIQTIGIEKGFLFFMVFLMMTIYFVVFLYMTAYSAGVHPFEVTVMKTATWLFIIPAVYIPLSNFGMLPLTGISYPFLAEGKSVFCLGYGILSGVIGGILERNHNRWLSFIV